MNNLPTLKYFLSGLRGAVFTSRPIIYNCFIFYNAKGYVTVIVCGVKKGHDRLRQMGDNPAPVQRYNLISLDTG